MTKNMTENVILLPAFTNDFSEFAIDESEKDNSPLQPKTVDITHIRNFLGCLTPQAWLDAALADLLTIIQDHANCEKKAASTAMRLLFTYDNFAELQAKLSQLIREEMLHYEQVMALMDEREQAWRYLPAGRYAGAMLKHKRTYEPQALIDVLIIGAFIEARSCERFSALANVLAEEKLAKYYRYLLKSESRHFEDYLALAQIVADNNNLGEIVAERVAFFRKIEAELITSPDKELRFHSGVPM